MAAGASAYAEEVRNLLDQLREGALSQEQFNEALARLKEDLAGILPAWEAWVKAKEEDGVNMEKERQALAQLQQALAKVGVEVKNLSRQRLDAWAQGLASTIQTAVNAVMGLFDAFSAQTIGGGISQFARGVSGLLSLIPGIGQGVASLVGAIGSALGSIVDGIISVFDSGWGKVQARIQEATRGLLLVDPAIFQRAVEQYTESYLFGLINVTKYRVNEEVLKSLQEAAKAAESAVGSGLRAALTSEDPATALRESLYNATLDAVVGALMESEAVRAALSPYTTALAEAIAQGSAVGVLRAAQGLSEAFAKIGDVLAPIREAFAQMRREMEASRMWEDAQKGASIAVESAIRAGAKAALEGKDISEAWRQALYNATLDALVQAFMNQGWMNMLQPLLNQLAGAILSSDEGAIPGIMAQIAAVIEAISRHMDNLGPIAEELRRLFGIRGEAAQPVDDTAKRLEEAFKNAASLRPGGPASRPDRGRPRSGVAGIPHRLHPGRPGKRATGVRGCWWSCPEAATRRPSGGHSQRERRGHPGGGGGPVPGVSAHSPGARSGEGSPEGGSRRGRRARQRGRRVRSVRRGRRARGAQKRPDGGGLADSPLQRLRNATPDAVVNATISEALASRHPGPHSWDSW